MRARVLRTFQCLYRASPPLRTTISGTTKTTLGRPPAAIRTFTTTPTAASGHSRWSKIKHDKGKADARRGASYSKLSQEVSYASREGGPDVKTNLRLRAAIDAAKKAGMPKDRITTAVERGQGKSSSGAALESVTVEAIGPGKIALVVDCLTDNKLRALQEVKHVINKNGGQSTQTSYLFSRKGMIRVLADPGGYNFDSILESALEVEGTEDVEEVEAEEGAEDGRPVVLIITGPSQTGPVAAEIKKRLPGLEIINYGIEWVPNEDTMVQVSEKSAAGLSELVEKLEDLDDVSEVYTNAKE